MMTFADATMLPPYALPGIVALSCLMIALPWISREGKGRAVVVMAAMTMTAYYVSWRITVTLPDAGLTIDFIMGMAFLALELAAVTGTVLSFIALTKTSNRSAEADAHSKWYGDTDAAPLVDVFICSYNEDREILERTIIGSKSMSYPNYRVWMLDDGRREWLRDMCEAMGCNYLSRGDNLHAKAGNMNHALAYVGSLDEKPEFISVLDADFVPARNFLDRAIALFHASDVGIVQTPQHFMNNDPIQRNLKAGDLWPDEQRYFFDVLLPAKDAWGTAFCCGTSSVIRFEALSRIGGFPTDSVTEDYLLTIRMKRGGYRTVYLNEALSLGLAPEGIKEYVTQRSRWCLGLMQIIRGKDSPFILSNGLSLMDRVSLVESLLFWTGAFSFRMAGLFIPILYFLFGIKVLDVGIEEALAVFLPYYIMNVGVIAWLSNKTVLPVMNDLSQIIAAKEILGAAAQGLTNPADQKFNVTAKGVDRSKVVIHWNRVALLGSIMIATVAGLVVHFHVSVPETRGEDAVALFWSWYNIIVLTAALAVCVERPVFRRYDRLSSQAHLNVGENGQFTSRLLCDLSVGGMRFEGETSLGVGDTVEISVEGKAILGRIVRKSAKDFAVRLSDDDATRHHMISYVYSGRFRHRTSRIRTGKLARRVFKTITA